MTCNTRAMGAAIVLDLAAPVPGWKITQTPVHWLTMTKRMA